MPENQSGLRVDPRRITAPFVPPTVRAASRPHDLPLQAADRHSADGAVRTGTEPMCWTVRHLMNVNKAVIYPRPLNCAQPDADGLHSASSPPTGSHRFHHRRRCHRGRPSSRSRVAWRGVGSRRLRACLRNSTPAGRTDLIGFGPTSSIQIDIATYLGSHCM